MRHLKALLLFATSLVAIGLIGCSTGSKERDEAGLRFRIGTGYLSKGNLPAALRELLLAEKLDPKNEFIQNNLGLTYFFRERYETALEHLKRALEIRPTFSEARNNYSRVLLEVGRYDEAIGEVQKVLADLTYDDPAKAWVNFGLAYFRKGDFKSAREKFAEAIKINRDHCLARTYYGRAALELKQYEVAAKYLDDAVVVCRASGHDEPWYFGGLTYYKLGRTSSAVARMEELIKLYPNSTYAPKAETLLKMMK